MPSRTPLHQLDILLKLRITYYITEKFLISHIEYQFLNVGYSYQDRSCLSYLYLENQTLSIKGPFASFIFFVRYKIKFPEGRISA